ncbi:NAD(+) diphosphatase [Lysobacter koreensis]|uniref:NAD(+) diphosphatase n=1 Tax=Lysobacter koreensis TaxID=266122 RepID=A0ABW2YP08_9GAMM
MSPSAATDPNPPPARTGAFAFVDPGSCQAALDRADHLREDADSLAALWPRARVIVLADDGQALADEAGRLCAPTGQEVSEGPGGVGAAVLLGLAPDGVAWFALDAALTAFDAPRRLDLRSAAALWPAFEAAVFAQARALQHWRRRHRHCGACGGAIAMSRGGWLGRCIQCGSEHYPRTDPAVIVAVSDGARLLLGRQASWPARRYSVLAGFVEPGESLEQTVAREVLEESGVRVRSCRYLASQPWPFPGALMLGFSAQAQADEPRVSDELEEARWFSADEVRAAIAHEAGAADHGYDGPLLSPAISISRWLIEQWLAEVTAQSAR